MANANVTGGTAAGSDDSRAGWALALGTAGLVAGLAGLALGLLAWRRSAARTT